MNERIKELHQQAKDFINEVSDNDGTYQGKEYMQAVREKFAELIVGECADLCSDLDGGENMFSRGIRKHFGVK